MREIEIRLDMQRAKGQIIRHKKNAEINLSSIKKKVGREISFKKNIVNV